MNNVTTLFKDGAECEDWAMYVLRSSLNSTNVPEIPRVVYSAFKAVIRSKTVSWD